MRGYAWRSCSKRGEQGKISPWPTGTDFTRTSLSEGPPFACLSNTAIHTAGDTRTVVAVPLSAMLVAVGSLNPVKSASAVNALQLAFPSRTVTLFCADVASGVPAQPMGDAETRLGAYTRALAAAVECERKHGRAPDFAVGMEGGCEDLLFTPPGPVAVDGKREMHCFAYIAVLDSTSGRWGCGRTGTFQLPETVAERVRGGMELGDADAEVFGRASNSKQRDGTVGFLTKGLISRAAYYEHAMILALAPLISVEHFAPASTDGI